MRILVFPFPLLAHYLRCAQLVEPLRHAHDIVFAGGCNAAQRVKNLGFCLESVKHFDSEEVLRCSRKFDFSWLSYDSLSLVAESHISAIERFKPDLVISDAAQVARIACEACKIPHVACVNAYMTRYYAGYRGLPIGHPAKRYEQVTPQPIFEFITRAAEWISMRQVHRPFNALRKKFHIKPIPSYLEEYAGDWTCILDDPKIFPVHPLPSSFHPIGPVYFDPSPCASGSAPRNCDTKDRGSGRIVVTLGSSGDWPQVHLLDDEIFAGHGVIALGKAGPLLSAPHVEKREFASPSEVLPGARAFICHGGNGSIYQALSYGVPVYCVPSMFEQEWNTSAFERAGKVSRIPAAVKPLDLDLLLSHPQDTRPTVMEPQPLGNLTASVMKFTKLFDQISESLSPC